jgi:hypothetical protein
MMELPLFVTIEDKKARDKQFGQRWYSIFTIGLLALPVYMFMTAVLGSGLGLISTTGLMYSITYRLQVIIVLNHALLLTTLIGTEHDFARPHTFWVRYYFAGIWLPPISYDLEYAIAEYEGFIFSWRIVNGYQVLYFVGVLTTATVGSFFVY